MNEPDDLALLQEYAARNSEAAFAELVSRRVDFVYSAALRQTCNPYLAEEVTQAVFILLAQKAGKISDRTILTGWLFKTTRFAALAQIRAEAKRMRRQNEFQMQAEAEPAANDALWNQLSPLLDEALAALGETDRQAVLLRFFENKSLAEIGHFLGIGEDTARKRISRALEKLHRYFNRRGVSSTTAVIAGLISANSVHAAPAGLATTITATAVKGSVVAASTLTLVKGTIKIMTYAKLKLALGIAVATLLTAGTATIAYASLVASEDKNSPGTASTQETSFANELMKATADENFQAFIADGDKSFKTLKERQFKAVCVQVSSQMKSGYHVIFIGSFGSKEVKDHITLWKVSYNDGSDDDLLHMSVKNDKITGALLTSPFE